jgi:hypothetical protein
MENTLQEVYFDVEKAIDYAFKGHFLMNFYDYLRVINARKVDVEEFIESPTAANISNIVMDLDTYLEGGSDNLHKQLREAYGHIPKPQARKIRNYLYKILEDAWKYENDKKRRKRKKQTK